MKRRFVIVVVMFVGMLLAACSGRRAEMDALLDRADSLNRAYIPMTGGLDSLLSEAAAWYDRHGSPNEQVRAHYLLGCAYRDMHEAPQALECYQQAVDCADTTAKDCDYQRLMSVYGQMAELYFMQRLPREEINARQKCIDYAEREKDTLSYVIGLLMMAKPYNIMEDTIKMEQILVESRLLFAKHHYWKDFYRTSLPLVHIFAKRGEVKEAQAILDDFEKNSGLLDADGTIHPQFSSYHDAKGLLLYRKGSLQEAEHHFRKLIEYEDYQDAYRGLLWVFQQIHATDSVVKYASLYEAATDTLHKRAYRDNLQTISTLYNYQRFQQKAEDEERQAERSRRHVYYLIVLFILGVSMSLRLFYIRRRKEKAKVASLLSQYHNALADYSRLESDASLLKSERDNLENVITALKSDRDYFAENLAQTSSELDSMKKEKEMQLAVKEKQITELDEQINEYKRKLIEIGRGNDLETMYNSPIVKTFVQKAKKKQSLYMPSAVEWNELDKEFRKSMPFASTVMGRWSFLSSRERYVCILLMLGFSHDQLCFLLGLSPQGMTNVKSRINRKLFNDASAASLITNLKKCSFSD